MTSALSSASVLTDVASLQRHLNRLEGKAPETSL